MNIPAVTIFCSERHLEIFGGILKLQAVILYEYFLKIVLILDNELLTV
jgi:hypothetical protein